MINWISLKDRKPEKPTSVDDINFKSDILFISGLHIIHARWMFFYTEGFILLDITGSEFGKEIDLCLEEFTHWTEINIPK